jgi:hypothetical protein
VPGRFPLYTDADIHGPLVEALVRDGWDVLRAIDRFPEGTTDYVHFDEAVRLSRVLVANESDMKAQYASMTAEGSGPDTVVLELARASALCQGEVHTLPMRNPMCERCEACRPVVLGKQLLEPREHAAIRLEYLATSRERGRRPRRRAR